MTEKIIKKIKSLPPLPQSVSKVRMICNDPEGSIKDLIPIIKQDPMFTADILKAANSPLYGFSRQINSIDQAVALFGMGTIQGFAVSYALRKTFQINLKPYDMTKSKLFDISFMQSSLALHWGKPQVTTYAVEMLTISLLMELGKVIASMVLIEENRVDAFLQEIKKAKMFEDIIKIEKSFIGITSEWIGALTFKHWQFNELMISMMHFIDTPEKAPKNIQKHVEILSVIKEALPVTNILGEACIQSAYEKADRFGLHADSLQEAIEKIDK